MSETTSIEVIHIALPAIAVLLPIIGSIITYPIGKKLKDKYGSYIASITTILVFLLTAIQYQYISSGKVIKYTLTSSSTLFPINFYVDSFGFIFALVTSFIWMLATIYSIKYMEKEHASNRFYFFLLLTLTANLGVVTGGDLFSIYVFFELLAIMSLILVVHEETKQAMEAGKIYFYIGVVGGLSLLIGILLFFSQTGSLSFSPQLDTLMELGNLRFLIAALMIIGFGAKAGIFPVHVWLPKAHPVAPTPASALLSGIMVKAGIFGIFRTTGRLFTPQEVAHATENFWALGDIGYWVIWIAIITAFLGWVLALLQDNMKRLLAYSTISQIGYIVLGIGSAAYLGYEGGYGYSGALYHVFNHAMFKTALFLVAGIIYYRTRELKMSKLGGLWREMPYTTAIAIISAAGITGIPLFNGYVSKTLLHHSIMEAFHATHSLPLHIAEILFVIIGGGTLAYYIKFIGFTFFGEKKYPNEIKKAPKLMIIPMSLIAAIVLFVGLFPKTLLNSLILPSLEMEALNIHQVEHLAEIQFYSLKNLYSISLSLIAGLVIFVYAYHYDLMKKKWPSYLGMTFLYTKLSKMTLWVSRKTILMINKALDKFFERTSRDFVEICTGATFEPEERQPEDYKTTVNSLLKITKESKERKGQIFKKYEEECREAIEETKNLKKEKQPIEVSLEDLSRILLYRDPVQFLKMFGTVLVKNTINKVLTIFLYAYVLIKRAYTLGSDGQGKINYSVKEEVKRIQRKDLSITPRAGSIGFALFIVASILAIYLIYELITIFEII